jgi:hypothetical protein
MIGFSAQIARESALEVGSALISSTLKLQVKNFIQSACGSLTVRLKIKSSNDLPLERILFSDFVTSKFCKK